jgi:hypothetical protein
VPYPLERLRDHSLNVGSPFTPVDLERALDSDLLQRFTAIYRNVMNKPPFQNRDSSERDLDIVPLVNLARFNRNNRPEAGLRPSLQRRFIQRGH